MLVIVYNTHPGAGVNIVLRKNSIMGLKQTGRIFTLGFLFLVLVKCNMSFTLTNKTNYKLFVIWNE